MRIHLWEVLVPCVMKNPHTGEVRPIRTRFHRVWDAKVRSIAGGLTILTPGKGQWVSPTTGETFVERMIPVRIACTRSQLDALLDMTVEYYNQEAVFAYLVSETVVVKHRRK